MELALPMDGGCNCGEVRYRLAKAPLTAYICHCHLCQKRTGSAFSLALIVPADGVEITAGEPRRTERTLPNGLVNTTSICGACFSRLFTHRRGAPTITLRAGTLDDTSQIRPVAQFWTTSAQPWAVVQSDILSYDEQPSDYAPLLAAWRGTLARG